MNTMFHDPYIVKQGDNLTKIGQSHGYENPGPIFAESRATLASNITTMSVPAPQAPRRDFKFFVRHSLGPWNPSYWASVWTAIREKDMDIYLYGADAIAYKTSMKIKQQADADIAKLNAKIAQARQQLARPFYGHRV